MNLNVIIGIVAVAAALAAAWPLYRLYRQHAAKQQQLFLRACKFALANYDRLVSPKLEVITEYRLRLALKTASVEDSLEIEFMLENMGHLGHPIDTYQESVYSGTSGFGPTMTIVTLHIYGISRQDLQKHIAGSPQG